VSQLNNKLPLHSGTQLTPTIAEELLRELCYETGGGFYYFVDAEDLRQQLVTLPYRSVATARQLHRPNQVASIVPHRAVVVEGNCSERPYSKSAASALEHRSLTTSPQSTSSVQWLEVLSSNSSRIQLQMMSHHNCSAAVLEAIPYATIEFYSKGAYNQLFAGLQTGKPAGRAWEFLLCCVAYYPLLYLSHKPYLIILIMFYHGIPFFLYFSWNRLFDPLPSFLIAFAILLLL